MKVQTAIAVAAILIASQALGQPQKPKPDWITTTNQPCKVWNPEPQPDESVTWSGDCKDGFATGKGVLRWTEKGTPDEVFDGEMRNGKPNGHGVLTTPDGDRVEGVWVDGERLTGDEGPPI